MPRRKPSRNRRFARRHVLDVKLRSSQRRSARLRTAALLLLIVAAIGLGGVAIHRGGQQLLEQFIYRNPTFAIHNLDIQTDGVVALEQLRRWTGVQPQDNLFALKLERVQRDLELVPLIRSASVERVLPHTLRIRVAERQPMAEVAFRHPAGIKRYLLDADGYVMFPLEGHQLRAGASIGTGMPSLVGVRAADLLPGHQTDSEQIRAALRLLSDFNRSSMVGLERIDYIDVRTSGLLAVKTERGASVTFGLDGFEAQLQRWRTIHEHGIQIGKQLTTLDLSVTNNLPARWQGREASPAQGIYQPASRRRNV